MPAATHYVAGLAAGALPVAPHDPVTGMPSAAALAELGSRLKAAGDWRGAAERYYEALRLDPTLLVAELNLGALFLASGDLQHALEHTERAYTLDPRSVDAMNNMGAICQAQANFETAAQWYRAALRLSPSCEATLSGLAMALVSRGLQIKSQDPKGAIKCYQEALVHSPMNANAYYNLGVSYAERHKYDKALINYSLTVHFDPRCAEAYNNMGVIYKEQENLDKALKCYHMAIQCNPRFAQTLNNLGVAYTTTGRLQEALEYLSRAVAVAPTYAEAYNNLGWLFWDHGDLAQALRMYERCIELSPTSKNPSQNRLLALNYLHGVSSERVFAAHRAWGERFCRELGHPFTDWLSARQMKRPLRVGYISPDFFTHSVSFFCHCLFEHRNSELFDIYLYSNTAREDEKTELFKNMVPPDRWKKVLGRPAQEVANLIREDSIDILIELAGHTANNRLDVVALKPAPVQFTYIGYNNTTGLGAVDYRVTDAVVDPPDSQQPFSEELVRLPGCFLCYTPPARIPDVEPLPALRTGYITFGSFSCLAKVSAPCVALWARVLREVPGSRLLVKNKGFYSADVQATFIEHFKRHGIAEDRLKLMALAPTSFDHLKIYNEVYSLSRQDIARTLKTAELPRGRHCPGHLPVFEHDDVVRDAVDGSAGGLPRRQHAWLAGWDDAPERYRALRVCRREPGGVCGKGEGPCGGPPDPCDGPAEPAANHVLLNALRRPRFCPRQVRAHAAREVAPLLRGPAAVSAGIHLRGAPGPARPGAVCTGPAAWCAHRGRPLRGSDPGAGRARPAARGGGGASGDCGLPGCCFASYNGSGRRGGPTGDAHRPVQMSH
uniref:Probable UDP-N-acetylglucosamine--peptide N-acetylglucosaminyltransferase SPINDLY n=1 Tax=Alexandrium monilatum TaxID=311494 RepID=A0A7S4PYH9_9DINO